MNSPIALNRDEKDAVRAFASSNEGIALLMQRALRAALEEIRDISNMPTDLPIADLGYHTLARSVAHDKLLEIFESLGFGELGNLLNKRESRERFD